MSAGAIIAATIAGLIVGWLAIFFVILLKELFLSAFDVGMDSVDDGDNQDNGL